MPVRKVIRKTVGASPGIVKARVPVVQVELPTSLSVPCNSLQDYSMLLFGEKKIGKTTMTAQFKNTLHLMFEPGGKDLAIYQRIVNNWLEFKQYVKLIKEDTRFNTITLDTVDYMYTMCLDYICTKHVISHPQDEGYGKGWKWVRDEFTKEYCGLLGTGKGIIAISHSKEEEIETHSGGKYHKIVPTASGQARDILEGIVDIWGYYGYEGKDRYLWIRGDDHIGAGNRLKTRFLNKDGTQIQKISMGTSDVEAYKNFENAFNNRYVLSESEKSETRVIRKVIRKLN